MDDLSSSTQHGSPIRANAVPLWQVLYDLLRKTAPSYSARNPNILKQVDKGDLKK